MSANIAIGNSIQNAAAGSHKQVATPGVQSYNQAQAASSVAQVSGAAKSYAAPRTQDTERMRSREVIRSIKQQLSHASSQYISEHAYQEVIASYQESMRNLFGEADDEAALHAEAQALLQQWKNVNDMGTRRMLVGKLSGFTSHVSSVAHALQDLQQQADEELEAILEDTNQTLRHLGAMNAALSSAQMLDQPTDFMEEERDALLATLAGYLGAETMVDNTGAVRAFIGQDTVLIGNGNAATLQYVANMPAYANPSHMLGAIRINDNQDIVSAARDEEGKFSTTSLLKGGALAGIQHARDVLIPETLERFDYTIENLRQGMEAMHHDAMQPSPMPALLGTRKLGINEAHAWEGEVEIALHSANTLSPGAPLRLNLSTLDDGGAAGHVGTQTLLRAINQHFHVPAQKVSLGALENVQLNLLVQQLPTVPSPSMRFDLACSTGEHAAHMFLHGVRVADDAGNLVHTEEAALAHALAPTPYSTSEGSNLLQLHATKPMHGVVAAGDMVYLPALTSGKRFHGIDAKMLSGCFEVQRVAGNDVFVVLAAEANKTGKLPINEKIHMQLGYQHVPSHTQGHCSSATRGALHCDLRAAPQASHYVVSLELGCNSAAGGYVRGTISYRVENHLAGLYNMRIDAHAASADARVNQVAESGAMVEAYLADDQGNSVGDAVGVLALKALRAGDMITVKAGSSKCVDTGADTQSFSQFFGLYALFEKAKPVIKHQPHVGLAANLSVSSALLQAPEKLAVRAAGADISCNAVDGISALHSHLCEQTVRAQDAVIEAENMLDGYQQRVDAVDHIDPAAEMTSIDTYHQSCMVSSRAISQISKLFQTLCDDEREGA